MFKIELLKPTMEFPNASIKLAFKNGNNACFSIIKMPELAQLSNFLAQTYTELEVMLPPLEQEASAIRLEKEKFEAQVSMIQQLQQNQGGFPNE